MKNSFIMFLDKMRAYLSFIDDCKNKLYEPYVVTHYHHVFPKCIYGKTNEVVKLSVNDHVQAHLLLSECYEKDSYENIANLRSARVLNKKSIKDSNILKSISESYLGEKNPFYGKTHSSEVIVALAKKSSDQCLGVSYEDRYGDRAKIEKDKRSSGVKKYWDQIDEASRLSRSQKIKEALTGNLIGEKNAMSKKVEVDGIVYGSLSLASKQLGLTTYFIKKKKTFKYIQ